MQVDGSIRLEDGMIIKGGCKLLFEDKNLTLLWPHIINHEVTISYNDIEAIYYSHDYSKIKIIYNASQKIGFESFSFLLKKALLSEYIQNIFKQNDIQFTRFNSNRNGSNKLSDTLKFWYF